MTMSLDKRARTILKAVVGEYIRSGAPVGSRALSAISGLRLSPATFRGVMADLEEMGLLASLHTSSGRIPSVRGLRFFVESLLTVRSPDSRTVRRLRASLDAEATGGELLDAAMRAVSGLTQFAGFVAAPGGAEAALSRLDFVRLSEKRVLIVMLTSDGEVINRVIAAPRDFSDGDLTAAANYFNRRLRGMSLANARAALERRIGDLQRRIQALLEKTLDLISPQIKPAGDLQVVGERNLLVREEFGDGLNKLRELFDLFERKKDLLRLLETGAQAENLRLFIGSECGLPALEECSVVLAPYRDDSGDALKNTPADNKKPRRLGVIGVIGPKRMKYDTVIPTVEITAKLVGAAMRKIRVEM
jgi:heat-inducible transcriptional repressor